ncbi:MAG: hypothetical protein ABI823_16125 [Bryobacteraceae bacterium]
MSIAHASAQVPVSADEPREKKDDLPGPNLDAAEVVRLMAHELRQPLSTIESIAYYLNLVLPREDGRAREQLSRLQSLVDQSNWILSNGVRCVEVSSTARELVDLEEVASDALARRMPEIRVDARFAGALPHVLLDPGQARHLVAGLLSLFAKGPADGPALIVTTALRDSRVVLELLSSRPSLGSLAGTSLSLESARQSAQANGGTLEFSTDSNGAKVSVSFPVFGKDA